MSGEHKRRGVTAVNLVITPNCRRVHGGAMEALEVALRAIRISYQKYVEAPANEDADWRIVLSVEWPDPSFDPCTP